MARRLQVEGTPATRPAMTNVFRPYDAHRRLGHACARCGVVHDASAPDPHAGDAVAGPTDAERLSAPGMVTRQAGVSFGNDTYATDAAAGTAPADGASAASRSRTCSIQAAAGAS